MKIGKQYLLVWLLFLVSGACGLIYEVLWCRHLGLIFGNTVQSLSAVLTAFMGGLALGSFSAGRICHRLRRPLFVYGILELLIGLYCAALPWLLSDHGPIVPFYRSLYGETGSGTLGAARFLISSALLLVPTTFMGATLPVLSQYLVQSHRALGRTVGTLYAVNSFGAALGAVAAGFFLLPSMGKAGTNWVAAACNITLGILAVVYGLRGEADEPSSGAVNAPGNEGTDRTDCLSPHFPQADVSPLALKMTVMVFGLTGFAAMATQIAWTRAISLGTGSSTYAFSLIVAVFILGISLGGLWASRVASKISDPLALLGQILLLIGVLNMALSALLGYGPVLFFFLLAWGSNHSWWLLLSAEALGITLLIICPTFLMGATLPLTLQVASFEMRGQVRADPAFEMEGQTERIVSPSISNAGRTTGTVYAVNTVGSILGSFFGGLLLLPLMGIQATSERMALLYGFCGCLLFGLSASRGSTKGRATMVAMALPLIALACFGPRWDPMLMSSGLYLLRDTALLKAARELNLDALPNLHRKISVQENGHTRLVPEWNMLYYKEGAAATVSVVSSAHGALTLRVGGKPDASSQGDMTTQLSLTLVPEILHAEPPQDVLIIGLGSGVSAGCALAMESIKHVDVVEMSPEVVEASAYFREYNGLTYTTEPKVWIDTPKLQVLVNDGRNHLLLSSRSYDVIASEPSNPWMAGVGNLFTREAFQLAHSRLKPGGIMCQWIHSYSLREEQFFSIIRTFGEVFANTQLWYVNQGDFLLIGSQDKIEIPFARLHERLGQPGIKRWLQRVHFDTEAEFAACYLCGGSALQHIASEGALHTDDNMRLEFDAPRSLYVHGDEFQTGRFAVNLDGLLNIDSLPEPERVDAQRAGDLAVAAREHLNYAIMRTGSADAHMRVAYLLAPYQFWAGSYQLQHPNASETPDQSAVRMLQAGDANGALAEMAKLDAAWHPELAALLRAKAFILGRDCDKALAQLAISVNKGTDVLFCSELAVHALAQAGRAEEALAGAERTLARAGADSDPATASLWALRANLLSVGGQRQRAFESLQIALKLAPDNFECVAAYARMLLREGNLSGAIEKFRTAAALDPFNVEIKTELAATLLAMADSMQDAAQSLELRHYARRTGREICALQPGVLGGYETLCRSLLSLAKGDSARADFYRHQAETVYQKALSMVRGEKTKLAKDVRDSIDR